MFVGKFLSISTKKSLKKNTTHRLTTDFLKSKSIGVIFSAGELSKHKAIKNFLREMEQEGKDVEVLSYVGRGRENHEFLFEIFTDHDVSFWGKITNETVSNFANQNFDYLFHLDTERNHIIENILARSKAKCRVGIFTDEENPYYDIMISPKRHDSVLELIDDMRHYTRRITV